MSKNLTDLIVGKKIFYMLRLYDYQGMKSSIVTSIQELENLTGKSLTIITMENGDRVTPDRCYFERSSESS